MYVNTKLGHKIIIRVLNLNSLTFSPRISSLRRAFTVFFLKPFLLSALTKPASYIVILGKNTVNSVHLFKCHSTFWWVHVCLKVNSSRVCL